MQMTATLARAGMEERVYMSNIVKAEIRRQQQRTRAANAAQVERSRMVEHSRDRLLARDLAARRAQAARRPGFFRRMAEGVATAWAVCFAAFFLYGEMLGLWEILDENE